MQQQMAAQMAMERAARVKAATNNAKKDRTSGMTDMEKHMDTKMPPEKQAMIDHQNACMQKRVLSKRRT